MKAISLWQLWASFWCSRRKVHETRHWRCSHRGWLLVHAAKRFEKDFDLDDPLRLILDDEFGGDWAKELPTGALIGMVNVVDCLPTQTLFEDAAASDDDRECGNFAPGRFAWKRSEFRLFDQPIPYRGAQGIFHVPDDVIPVGWLSALTRLSRVALLRPGGGWIADIRLNAPERAGLRVAALVPVSGSPRMAARLMLSRSPRHRSVRLSGCYAPDFQCVNFDSWPRFFTL